VFSSLIVLALLSGGVTEGNPASALVPQGRIFEQDIAYGNESARQKLDILHAKEHRAAHPAILYIHGGGWSGGDKGDDPEMMMGMLNGFADDGFVALSINYRLEAEAKFPAAVQDCKLAVRWLRAHAAEYGVDPNRIGIAGGSAGGHLAAMLALTGDDKASDKVQAAVSVSGPTDLTVDLCSSKREDRRAMVANFLGVPAADNMDLARKASPISYVRAETPPILLVHCKEDPAIDADQSIRLADALKKAGAPVQLQLLDGTNHGSDMARTEPVLSMIREFFRGAFPSNGEK
jgi:acetyl esterase/lipase